MAKKNPPKIGEIRIGRAGNKYNKWTGSKWVPVAAARTAGAQGRKPSVVSKPVSSKSSTPSSLQNPASGAKTTGRTSPGAAAAKARATSSYKSAQKKVSKSRVAASRQSAIKTYARLANPITGPASLAQIIAPKSAEIQKAAFRKAKNWWEGG